MTTRFSISIEEEFQMVDRQTGQLCPLCNAADNARHPYRCPGTGRGGQIDSLHPS
jgi:hypothetical protein